MGTSSSKRAAAKPTSVGSATSAPADPALISLLGDSLASKTGAVSTADALAGKSVIALYFSAHWCPPCRGFTPVLAEAYTQHLKAAGVEIVFVSSDRDQKAFSEYFKSMPWLALPFSARSLKQTLGEKYRVQGIPSLILLNSDGSLLTTEGRKKVSSDPTGKSWLPAAQPAAAAAKPAAAAAIKPAAGGLESVLGSAPLLATDGKTSVGLADVVKDAPLVALYFSAHWCGPCRGFTPKLVTFVEMLSEEGISLPLIFGSSDRDQKSFDEYFASMPWCAFPHGDERIEALKTKYEVSGIPWLVVLDAKTGKLVVNEADTDVPQGPQAYQKWLKLVNSVAAAPAA